MDKNTSFKVLLDFEPKFDEFIHYLEMPVKNNDRIHLSYKLIGELESVRLKPAEFSAFLKKHDNRDLYYALHDIYIIYGLVPLLHEQNKDILRIKFLKILEGTNARLETTENSVSRNTLFELLIFYYFKKSGYSSELTEPNPDVTVQLSKKYLIECKRLFNDTNSTFKRNIKEAAVQLTISLNKGLGDFGIIALSIEPFYTKKGTYLVFDESDKIENIIRENNRKVIQTFGHYWQNKKYVNDERILAVIVHLTMPSNAGNEFKSVFYLTINNTRFPATREFKKLSKELDKLMFDIF